jgi:hypothetical protein
MAIGLTLLMSFVFSVLLKVMYERFDTLYTHFERQLDQKQDLIRELHLKVDILEGDLRHQIELTRDRVREDLRNDIIDKLDYITNVNLRREDEQDIDNIEINTI